MTDKEYEREKRRVQKILDKWLPPLWLRNWDIEVRWERGAAPDEAKGYKVLAQVHTLYQYSNAEMTVWLEEVAKHEDRDLELGILHELCHIILDEMHAYSKDPDHEERVADHMARALVSVRDYVKRRKL